METIKRRKTRPVKIGPVTIGSGFPVAIQSMTKVPTCDVGAVLRQIEALREAGCEIVRLAVKDEADARALAPIKKRSPLPLVADIHFNWRFAVRAIDSGVDKIRLNPGNIAKEEHVRAVAAALKQAHIPVRIGVNSGSVAERSSGKKTVAARLTHSALAYVRRLERLGVKDIVLSAKASTALETVAAYRLIASACDYPLHIGVTATGLPRQGLVKSSIACGMLLAEGIGDTMRVSLTDDPCEEVKAARSILEALQLRSFGPEIISCPTCGRCEVDLKDIVADLERSIARCGKLPALKVAVMGCVVNGPGESREADIGVAFGKGEGLFFRRGRPQGKIAAGSCAQFLLKELRRYDKRDKK